MSEYVKENEIPNELKDKIVPYHWCKDYIIQKNIESPFMPFLSKFGFIEEFHFYL